VTRLALNNPIAILMMAIGVVVFAVVTTPRMSIDTFPELTPPVLLVGTLAPGLGPKDVEKTLTWRIEKYVMATPGVDHVESISSLRDGGRSEESWRSSALCPSVRPLECPGGPSRRLRRWTDRTAAL
jgi:multidrug efflux pump subunit AcrB